MDAGLLRHRVELQKITATQDQTTGEEVRAWATYATVWAAVEPLSVRDFIAAQAGQSETRGRITIRHRTDVTAEHRVKHGSTIYRVQGVMADKDSGLEYLTLAVSEGVSVDGA